MSVFARRWAILIGGVTLPLLVILISLATVRSPGAPDVSHSQPVRVGVSDTDGDLADRTPGDDSAGEVTPTPAAPPEGDAPAEGVPGEEIPPERRPRDPAPLQAPGFAPYPPPVSSGDGPGGSSGSGGSPESSGSSNATGGSGSTSTGPVPDAPRQVRPPVQTRPAPGADDDDDGGGDDDDDGDDDDGGDGDGVQDEDDD